MSDVEVIQVVRTRLERRGKGTVDDVMRVITQYWSMDGALLWEEDPVATPAPLKNEPPLATPGASPLFERKFRRGERVVYVGAGARCGKVGTLIRRIPAWGDLWAWHVTLENGMVEGWLESNFMLCH